MKLKKMAIGMALAGATVAVGAPALAVEPLTCSYADSIDDRRAHLVGEIERVADALRCVDYGRPDEVADDGTVLSWVNDGDWDRLPIWQYKRNENGCEVHEKLARQLHEERSDDPDSKPPRNKWDNNDAAGAATDVDNHKYDAAITKLTSFYETIMYSYANKYNEAYDESYSPGAAVEAGDFALQADNAIGCITDLIVAEELATP